MVTSSNGNIFRVTGLCVRWIHRPPVNSPQKGQWCGALVLSLTCAWLNGWVNNRAAGDLRSRRPHYDVTVMVYEKQISRAGRLIYIPQYLWDVITCPWASWQIRKIAGCACRQCRERFPRHRGLAIPTCITARAWRTWRAACRDR